MYGEFHYYGTYAAAILAGYNKDDAKVIATAAQMVDECDENMAKRYGKGLGIVTCQTNGQLFIENFGEMSSKKRNYIRRVWMAFHFLPGNINEVNESEYVANDKIELSQKDDFVCMCRVNSKLVKKMIDATKIDVRDMPREEKLNLIGVRMHVLADTWAHQFFTGSPSSSINDAAYNSFKRLDNNQHKPSKFTPPAISDKSVFYLGHGRAGDWPDSSNISYLYAPSWMKPDNYIIKDNRENFICAFLQMVYAMKCIKDNGDFVLPPRKFVEEKKGVGLPDELKGLNKRYWKEDCEYYLHCLTDQVNLEQKEIDKVQAVLSNTVDFGTDQWIKYIKEDLGMASKKEEDLNIEPFKKEDALNMWANFQIAALAQCKFVVNELYNMTSNRMQGPLDIGKDELDESLFPLDEED